MFVCLSRDYFVVDLPDSCEPGAVDEATLTFIDAEADKTAYHDVTVVREDSLKSELDAAYKQEEEQVKWELELSKKPKVLVTIEKVVDLIPKTCGTSSS